MSGESPQSPLLNPLRGMLTGVAESERRTLLATLTAEFGGGGRTDAGDPVGKKLQHLEKEKARLEDELLEARSHLAKSEKQLEAERAHGGELQQRLGTVRGREDTTGKEMAVLEAKVVELNHKLHQAEVEGERLARELQKADLRGGDTSQVDRLETKVVQLTQEVERTRAEVEPLRREKDARIVQLEAQLQESAKQQGGGEEKVLQALWDRLARSKPPLVEGHVPPNVQCFERLIDAFAELVRFVDNLDNGMRVFLDRYTKYLAAVKAPWEAYAKGDNLTVMVQRILPPQGGKPVGPMKMRLMTLRNFIHAATVACDSAIESIDSELQAHLMGPVGAGGDPNRKLRDYVKADGHMLFSQHMKELRSQRLAETYGRG